MMRRRIATVLITVMATMALSVGALAHSAPPCNDSGEPGNSDYARHHISALAKEGALGDGGLGHIPGHHQGFSLCLGVHN